MKKVIAATIILFILILVICGCVIWGSKREIVIPVGVSYNFSSFRVDQMMTSVAGDFSKKEWHDSKRGYSKKTVGNESVKSDNSKVHTSKITTKVGVDANFTISSIVAGGLAAIDPRLRVGADRSGELAKEKSDSGHADKSTEIVKTESDDVDSRYEKNIKGALGDYYLHFTLMLKNNDPDDVYVVKANNRDVKVLIRSVGLEPALEIPVTIPDADGREIRCGETIIPVSSRISSTQNLEQLIECQRLGLLRDRLYGVIVPQDFPLMSVKNGRNIFEVMAENEIRVPTTEVVLDFGDAGKLSPWRVRRNREPRFLFFGERMPVSVGEALRGINNKIASSGAFNSGTFYIDSRGNLKRVAGVPSGKFDCNKGVVLGVEFDGVMRYEAVGSEELGEDVGNYKRIRFVEVDVRSIASNLCQGVTIDYEQRRALQKMLEQGQDNVPESRVLLGRILVSSNDLGERRRGLDLLCKYAEEKNKYAFLSLIEAYVASDGRFEHENAMSKCLREMRTSEWAADNYELAAKCLARLLKEGGRDDEFLDVVRAGFPQVDLRNESVLMAIAASRRVSLLEKYLALKLVDVNLASKDGLTAMSVAVDRGDVDVCRTLCDAGADVDQIVNGQSYLELIVGDDQKNEIVNLLIEKGALRRCGSNKENADKLMRKACDGHAYKNIELLIKKGMNVGAMPFRASECGDLEMVRWFVDGKHIEINAVDRKHGTMLMAAAKSGKYETCKFLIDRGANAASVPDAKSLSAFELAWRSGNEDVVRLLQASALEISDTDRLMGILVSDGSAPLLQRCLHDGGGVFMLSKNLFEASMRHDCPESFRVCRKKLGLTSTSFIEDLPLIYKAAECNAAKIVRSLINEGVDVNSRLRGGDMLPIEYAARCGSLAVIKVMVEHGGSMIGNAPYESVDRKDFRALDYFWSISSKGSALVTMKYDAGGGTLLTYAAFTGNIDAVRFLLSKGFDVNSVDKKNWTPLEKAILNDQLEMVRYLISVAHADLAGAPVVAAEYGKMDAVRYFIEEQSIGVHYTSPGAYMFARAAYRGQKEICRYLVARGAKVDFSPKCEDGGRYYSAMEFVLREKNDDMVKFLQMLRGEDVINPPVNIAFRGDYANEMFGAASYVMELSDVGGESVRVTIMRGGREIKRDLIVAHSKNSYGWNELDRSFKLGDSGEIVVDGYARKLYYSFNMDGKLEWHYGD